MQLTLLRNLPSCVTRSFRREVDKICAFLGCCAARQPTVTIFKGQEFKRYSPLKIGLISCTETSVRSYHYSQGNRPEEQGSLIPVVQPTRCTCYLKLFILVKRSACFGQSFCPSSGAQNCVYSNDICQTAAATCC